MPATPPHNDDEIRFNKESRSEESKPILYLANLDYEIDELTLMKFINLNGFNPIRAKILYDRESRRSKGCAFVQMSTMKEALDASNSLNKQDLHGREISVRQANTGVY